MNTNIITNTSINNFSNWLGLHPLNFNGLDLSTCTITNPDTYCQSFYRQYSWQPGNTVSIQEMAEALKSAENSVIDFIGTSANPKWITNEIQEWPYFYRREYGKLSSISACDDIKFITEYNCIDYVGQRINTFLSNIDISGDFVDLDGDGVDETVEFTVNIPATIVGSNGLTISIDNLEDIAFYHPSLNGEDEFKITPYELVSFNTTTRNATYRINSWLLLKLNLYYYNSFAQKVFYSICDVNNLIASFDMYYESVDDCIGNGFVVWKDSLDCSLGCPEVRLPACIKRLDYNVVSLRIQDTDAVTGCVTNTTTACLPNCPPKYVELNYRTKGNRQLQECVFMIAAARLPKLLCTCEGCLENNTNRWQDNVNDVSDGSMKYVYPFEERLNPIGSRVGEIEAWKKMSSLKEMGLC